MIFIKQEIKKFNDKFKKYINIEDKNFNNINLNINKGKQIRPKLILIISKIFGNVNNSIYYFAILIELIHNASILHDDVIDNNHTRRNKKTINSIWKNKISILIGDLLLSKVLLLINKHKYFNFLSIISNTIKKIVFGELIQLKLNKYDINEKKYYKIIKYKTANLISTSCEGTTKIINSKSIIIKDIKKFGLLIGIAFQIQDDLLDYNYKNNKTGKPFGMDIKNKTITLPLIYTLNKVEKKKKKKIMNNIFKNNIKTEEIIKIIKLVDKFGGLKYTTNKIKNIIKEAFKILNKYKNNYDIKPLYEFINSIFKYNY